MLNFLEKAYEISYLFKPPLTTCTLHHSFYCFLAQTIATKIFEELDIPCMRTRQQFSCAYTGLVINILSITFQTNFSFGNNCPSVWMVWKRIMELCCSFFLVVFIVLFVNLFVNQNNFFKISTIHIKGSQTMRVTRPDICICGTHFYWSSYVAINLFITVVCLFVVGYFQELLTYLAMFVKSEPSLFDEMLQIRVGLIMEVMAAEYARTSGLTGNWVYRTWCTLKA